jgi:outer membrane protein assembly factor BamB/tRNA A-37 threonylcarbamoyl transferase component Bud32
MRSAVAATYPKTAGPADEPGKDDGRGRRLHIPGRNNLLKVGTVLQNRYRVLDIRGVGGMSTVYKARDLRFTSVDRLCAIKEMFNSAEDAKLRQVRLANFQREASLLATMTHSAIPRIYDYFEQQGTIYLVLELIHGEDLETLLSQNGGPFDQEKVVDWAIALCSVIAYLHNQKPEPIIFRDLKPSNIMIRSDDESLMLVDFGIARSFAPQQKGTMIGTEGYAPPEQYKGVADARGDIYALGATLHHLVTGSDPRSETPFTFNQRPPRKYNAALSQDFEELILRCVSYSPNDRPQCAEDVRHILEQIRYSTHAPQIPDLSPPPVPTRQIGAVAAPERERSAGSNLLGDANQHGDAAIREVLPAEPSGGTAITEKQLDWSIKTGDEVRGSASYAGGSIYIGSYDGNLYALDDADGAVRWRFKSQRGIVSRPAVHAEMVVFGSEDKTVYAVSRSSGRAIWSFRTDAPVRSSPFVDERCCIIGSDDGFVYRIDRAKGVVTWRYKTWAPVRSSPTVVDDKVLFGSDDGYLYTVHRENGSLIWRYQVGSPIISSPVVVGGQVIVGASDGVVRAFSLADGKVQWAAPTAKAVWASPAVEGDLAYVGSADGHMYALTLATGTIAWKAKVCRQITSTATIDGDKLYVGGNDAIFYCLNREDGTTGWTFGAGGPIVARPLLTDDHVVFGSFDGFVYALNRE